MQKYAQVETVSSQDEVKLLLEDSIIGVLNDFNVDATNAQVATL